MRLTLCVTRLKTHYFGEIDVRTYVYISKVEYMKPSIISEVNKIQIFLNASEIRV